PLKAPPARAARGFCISARTKPAHGHLKTDTRLRPHETPVPGPFRSEGQALSSPPLSNGRTRSHAAIGFYRRLSMRISHLFCCAALALGSASLQAADAADVQAKCEQRLAAQQGHLETGKLLGQMLGNEKLNN